MKEEIRKVAVLDWEDKIKLQQVINDLEQIVEYYNGIGRDVTSVNDALYYLKLIVNKIS